MTTDNPDPLVVFVWDTDRLDQVFTAASMKHGYYESLIAVAAEGARIKHAPVIAENERLREAFVDLRERDLVTRGQLLGLGHIEVEEITKPQERGAKP